MLADSLKRGGSGIKLITVLTSLGLTSNLQICLDSGDEDSYTSGQKWLDVSGNGYDFTLGASDTPTTDDPTFNGNAGGMSIYEYFSYDGGDYFEYDTTNETWMNNLNKENAVFSVAQWCFVPPLTAPEGSAIWGNGYGAVGDEGIYGYAWRSNTTDAGKTAPLVTGELSLTCQNIDPDNYPLERYSDGNAPQWSDNQWNFFGLSLDETGGNVSFFYANGDYVQSEGSNTWDANFSGPSNGNPSAPMRIGSIGAGSGFYNDNGTKDGMFAMWTSALTKANFDSIYAATRGRYNA